MASELQASSSSQQPFATPQPAPISTGSQATSPPTKQSLKSWWKGFRPPAKTHETHGNDPSHTPSVQRPAPAPAPAMPHFFASNNFATRVTRNLQTSFREAPMHSDAPVFDGPLPKAASPASFRQQTSTRYSFFKCLTGGTKRMRRYEQRSNGHLKDMSRPQRKRSRNERSSSAILSTTRAFSSRNTSSTAGCDSDGSGRPLSDGLLSPTPPFKFSLKLFNISQVYKFAKRVVVEQPTGIFGVPLRQSITYANVAISLVDGEGKSYIYGYVPIVVAKCGVYLKEKATTVEGIFRLSGSEKRIKELKTIFDSPDRYGKGLDWAGYTVHDAANVLRRYLNLLPEPIVPLDLYDRFRDPLRGHTKQAVGDNEGPQLDESFDVSKAIVTYQQLITELPPLNRQLLLYILDLLAVFASKSDENRMNSQNLAAIFQPGMLSHPQHDMAPLEYRLSQDVLIFLIENQDHFLIGMRGTAADEKTVQEVQSGGTPPLGTPTTPGRSKNTIGRSSSNASAGADSVRKFGGVRRNVSVSSRHSKQSNGAPSPATPTYGATLSHTASGGIHRSNTVPSKKSPGLPQGRLQKHSGSPSPPTALAAHPTAPRGLSPSAPVAPANRNASPSSPGLTPTAVGVSTLAPSSHAASGLSQERLLGDPEKQEVGTPTRERNITSLFQRSPTTDSERKQPNKLRKKRIPSSSNPSAQSSTHSLGGQQSESTSPALRPVVDTQEPTEHPVLEPIPSANPLLSNTEPTPPATETPRAESLQTLPIRSEEHHQSSDNTLKPKGSPVSSLHSRSSFNEQSDLDHIDDPVASAEQKEKRSRWRLSRRRDDSQPASVLSPPKTLGSDVGAGASSSSIGSSARPRKSFTGDTVPVGSESNLVGTHLQASNDSSSAQGAIHASEEKKGLFGRFKDKIRGEKREEKEVEKERNKSPPAATERLGSLLPTRGKSIDVKREEHPERIAEEPPLPQAQQNQR